MTTPNTTTASRRGARTIGVALAASLLVVTLAGSYWRTHAVAQDTGQANSISAQPVSYPAPGKDPVAKTEFPAGAAPVSGPEIVAALSDHTALLPGGFVEYYAPDGKIHGLAEEKHYGGSWEVRDGDFCTLLQGSTDSIYGDPEASPVSTIPGNPRNLQ
jgi:hypothetical protein